jgi:hypothetical protein
LNCTLHVSADCSANANGNRNASTQRPGLALAAAIDKMQQSEAACPTASPLPRIEKVIRVPPSPQGKQNESA